MSALRRLRNGVLKTPPSFMERVMLGPRPTRANPPASQATTRIAPTAPAETSPNSRALRIALCLPGLRDMPALMRPSLRRRRYRLPADAALWDVGVIALRIGTIIPRLRRWRQRGARRCLLHHHSRRDVGIWVGIYRCAIGVPDAAAVPPPRISAAAPAVIPVSVTPGFVVIMIERADAV